MGAATAGGVSGRHRRPLVKHKIDGDEGICDIKLWMSATNPQRDRYMTYA